MFFFRGNFLALVEESPIDSQLRCCPAGPAGLAHGVVLGLQARYPRNSEKEV